MASVMGSPPSDINSVPVSKTCKSTWGSHGCYRPRGHDSEAGCWCDCCTCDEGKHPQERDGAWCVAGPPYYDL
jgi:hypothetical protein